MLSVLLPDNREHLDLCPTQSIKEFVNILIQMNTKRTDLLAILALLSEKHVFCDNQVGNILLNIYVCFQLAIIYFGTSMSDYLR